MAGNHSGAAQAQMLLDHDTKPSAKGGYGEAPLHLLSRGKISSKKAASVLCVHQLLAAMPPS
jgi:hypothetical protein